MAGEADVNFYGCEHLFPPETPQLLVELKCFRWQVDSQEGYESLLPSYQHLENFIRLNWKPEDVMFEGKDRDGREWDNYFLKAALKSFCTERELLFTGCASSGKTHPSALYALCSFYSAPDNTTVLTSTTSSSGADGRIWSSIKALHDAAEFKIGKPLEYIKSIVFDPAAEMEGKQDTSQRDLRDALLVVPIGRGAEGRAATRAIIGRKNEHIIWIVDELPEMDDGILQDTIANLENNPFFQFIGLGNASSQRDPHGQMCEPVDGWGTETTDNTEYGGTWKTKSGGHVIFFDGHKSPNMHEELFHYENKNDLPFPFLANHIGHERNALRYGHGDPEQGVKTLPYMRMSRGIWPDSSIEQTVLAKSIVVAAKADERPLFNYQNIIQLCGCDPAFSAGGDAFVLHFATFGTTWDGQQILLLDHKEVALYPVQGEDYREGMARQVVDTCTERGVSPSGFGIDGSADGGLVAQEIMKKWGSTDIHVISSMGRPTDRIVSSEDTRPCNEAYDRMVTELWFSIRVGVMTGVIKGYNVNSGYAKDHFNRLYLSKGNDKVSIEVKRDMKKRYGRSPDPGDATAYLVEVARRSGLEFVSAAPEMTEEKVEMFDPYQQISDNQGGGMFDAEQMAGTGDPFDQDEFELGWN